jgi:sulfur carrier protein ThiS
MKILVINNHGGGYADYMEVEAGTTVPQLFNQVVPGGKADDYLIRINRQPVPKDHILQEGERVSITPVKIEGA